MNEIWKRISVRKYMEKPVEPEKTEMMLRAAMAAPTAMNRQPWQFMVLEKRETLQQIAQKHPYAEMLHKAPMAILVCGDTTKDPHLGYLAIDCAAATENILLEAVSQGLGTCWLGIYPREERMEMLRELLELPEEVVPMMLIAVGYPLEIREREDCFDKGKVHYDKW